MIAEHALVVLTADKSDAGLSAGDIGTVVFVYAGGAGYEVEFADGDGRTIALLTLDKNQIRPFAGGELLHARKCE